jgi:adenylate cyclase
MAFYAANLLLILRYLKFSVMNSSDSVSKENKTSFDLSLINENELQTVVNRQLNCQDKYIPSINKIVLDIDNAFPEIVNIQTCFAEIEKRILEAFEKGPTLNPRIERSDQFLQQYIGSKQKLVVLYVDLVDSTLLMRNSSVDKLATIIQVFYREMSVAISNFNGQVLKYVGDAVIAFFPMDIENSFFSCTAATKCAFYMIDILEEVVNPILMQNKYESLQVRIGIDASEHSIIQYVLGEKSYTDILGYGISMAAKLTKLVNPNQIATSHSIYVSMNPSLKKRFSELEISPRIWKYIDGKIQTGIWKSQ